MKKKGLKHFLTGIEPATSRVVSKVVHRTVCKAHGLHAWQTGFTQLRNACSGLSDLCKYRWLNSRSLLGTRKTRAVILNLHMFIVG